MQGAVQRFGAARVIGAWGEKIEKSKFIQRMHHLRKKLREQCEMEIIDSLWCLKSFHFSFPKFHLAEYDEFIMDAVFEPNADGLWLCTKQDFY